jgi:hypothetical protein
VSFEDKLNIMLPPFKIVNHFSIFRFIVIIMHLDIHYIKCITNIMHLEMSKRPII